MRLTVRGKRYCCHRAGPQSSNVALVLSSSGHKEGRIAFDRAIQIQDTDPRIFFLI